VKFQAVAEKTANNFRVLHFCCTWYRRTDSVWGTGSVRGFMVQMSHIPLWFPSPALCTVICQGGGENVDDSIVSYFVLLCSFGLYACFQMASVLNNELGNISSVVVVDCRYPYEYEGGHVQVWFCFESHLVN